MRGLQEALEALEALEQKRIRAEPALGIRAELALDALEQNSPCGRQKKKKALEQKGIRAELEALVQQGN